MIGFYYGTSIPSANAKEGIYFVKIDNKYSIYIKRDTELAKYGETNEVMSSHLDDLWSRIGQNFVAKSFTVAGLDLEENISVVDMQNALELQGLAYKSEATGTLTDYVTEVKGVDYTPTGTVEVILGYDQTATIISNGKFTPAGSVTGSTVAKGEVSLVQDPNGFAVSGSVSAPEINIVPKIEQFKQITGVGSLPSYTPAEYTAPSLSSSDGTFATEGTVTSVDGEKLVIKPANTANAIAGITYNAGVYTAAQFNPGTLPAMADVSVMTGITSATATAPEFTGDGIKAVFTGASSDINATFSGVEGDISVSGTYDKAIVDKATFNGNSTTIAPQIVKENKTVTVQ